MSGATAPVVVHGTAFVVGEVGVLVRGPSGTGKSRLAREVIAAAMRECRFARLVADDRVELSTRGGAVVARPVPPLVGLLEVRGVGLADVPCEPAALLGLVVDIEADGGRLPSPADRECGIAGARLSRIVVNFPSAPGVVLWRLGVHSDVLMTVP